MTAVLDAPVKAPFKYPDVALNDFVLFSKGPDDPEWSPMLVTGINKQTVRDPKLDDKGVQVTVGGKPQWIERDEITSIRGCVFAHTEACIQVPYKNVYYYRDPKLDDEALRRCVTLSHSQGIWKPGAALLTRWKVEEELATLRQAIKELLPKLKALK